MGENLVAGILKNIQTLSEVNANQNVSILTSINKTNTLISDQIGKELTKQTKLLESIIQALKGGINNSSNSFSIFGNTGTAELAKVFKKRGGKALQKMALGMDKFADATKKFVDAVNELDKRRFDKFATLFNMGKKIMAFALLIAVAAPLLLFGLLFTLPILGIWIAFFVTLYVFGKPIREGGRVMMWLAVSTGLIVATILLAALMIKEVGFKSILLVIGVLIMVTTIYVIISQFSKSANTGAKTMMFLALTSGIIVATILLSSLMIKKVGWESIALVAGVLIGVSAIYIIISQFDKKSNKGAKSMMFLALTTAIIVAILFVVGFMDLGRLAESAFVLGIITIGLAIIFTQVGKNDKKIKKGAAAMLFVALTTAIISAIFVIVSKHDWKRITEAATVIGLTTIGLAVIYFFIGKKDKKIKKGVVAMLFVALSTAIISAIFVIVAKQDLERLALAALVVGAVISGLAIIYGVIGKKDKKIKKGVMAMLLVALSTLVIIAIIVIAAMFLGSPEKMLIAMALLGLGIVVLGGAFAIVGAFKGKVIDGALGLLVGAFALIVIAGALYIFNQVNVSLDDLMILGATVFGLGLVMALAGKLMKPIIKGSAAMIVAALALIVIAGAVAIFMINPPSWEHIGMLGALVLGLGVVMAAAGFVSGLIIPGAASMIVAAVALIAITGAMALWMVAGVTWEGVGTAAATILGLGVVMAAAGLVSPLILLGSVAMILGTIAVIAIAGGMTLWMAAKVTWKAAKTLGKTLALIGFVMAAAGLVSPLILLGAIAMTLVAVPVVVISGAMALWMKAKVKWKDVKVLGKAIALLGVEMAAFGLFSAFIITGALAMGVIAGGLLVFTTSLFTFKKAKWSNGDSKDLVKTLTTILDGFIDVFDKVSDEDIEKAMKGTRLLSKLGNSLGTFAEGLMDFANGSQPNWVEKPDGTLEIKGRKPLDSDLGKKVGETIKKFLTPLVGKDSVLAALGKDADSFWTTSPTSAGISLLGKLGNSLGGFAMGLQNMANLVIPTYGLNDKGEMIVTKLEQMDESFGERVGTNIAMMVDALTGPLTRLGMMDHMTSGGAAKGIELMGLLGNSLGTFAKGIGAWAKMEIPVWGKNAKGELVIVDYIKIKKGFAKKIATNIGDMIDALKGPIERLGKQKSSWYEKDSTYEAGLSLLGKLGEPLEGVANAIAVFGSTTISARKVKSILQSSINAFVSIISKFNLSAVDLSKAKKVIATFKSFTALLPKVKSNPKNLKAVNSAFQDIITGMSSKTMANLDMSKVKGVVDGFSVFSYSLSKLKGEQPDKIGELFVTMKDSINDMNLEKLNKLNDLASNLRHFAANMEGSFDNLEEVLIKLKDVIAELNEASEKAASEKSESKDTGFFGFGDETENDNKDATNLIPLLTELQDITKTLQGGIDVTVSDSASAALFGG